MKGCQQRVRPLLFHIWSPVGLTFEFLFLSFVTVVSLLVELLFAGHLSREIPVDWSLETALVHAVCLIQAPKACLTNFARHFWNDRSSPCLLPRGDLSCHFCPHPTAEAPVSLPIGALFENANRNPLLQQKGSLIEEDHLSVCRASGTAV